MGQLTNHSEERKVSWSRAFKENMSDYERELYGAWVRSHQYTSWHNKTTVVVLTLFSGFEITGTAGCEDPSKFSDELGHLYALKDALRKLGEFAAFWRAECKHQQLSTLPAKELRVDRELSKEELAKLRDMWMKDLHDYENAHNSRFHNDRYITNGINTEDCTVDCTSSYPSTTRSIKA